MDLSYKGYKYNHEEIKKFIEVDQYTKTQIIDKTGINRDTLNKLIKKYGFSYGYTDTVIKKSDVINYLTIGMKKAKIARLCGCHVNTIYRIGKDADLC